MSKIKNVCQQEFCGSAEDLKNELIKKEEEEEYHKNKATFTPKYTSPDAEEVNHPPHYNKHPTGIECIDVIEHMPLNIGTAIKYLWRCDEKHPDPSTDLRKALWYIERELKRRGFEVT